MDNNSKLACHAICLLADAMKHCKTCLFNPAYVNLPQDKAQTIIKAELQKELEKEKS